MYLQGQLLRNKKELDKRATMPGGEELETIHLLHHHHQGPLKGMERKRGGAIRGPSTFFCLFYSHKGDMKKRRIEGQAHWRREKRYDFTILPIISRAWWLHRRKRPWAKRTLHRPESRECGLRGAGGRPCDGRSVRTLDMGIVVEVRTRSACAASNSVKIYI